MEQIDHSLIDFCCYMISSVSILLFIFDGPMYYKTTSFLLIVDFERFFPTPIGTDFFLMIKELKYNSIILFYKHHSICCWNVYVSLTLTC